MLLSDRHAWEYAQGLVGGGRILAFGRGGLYKACKQGGDGHGDQGQRGVNKLHLILDYLLRVNSNKYHLHFIVLFCPDINNLGHVGGEAGKARVAGTPSVIGGNMATPSRLSGRPIMAA